MKTKIDDKLRFKLLITTAGSGAGYYLVRCAKALGVKTVMAGDTNPAHLVAASALADRFFRLPPAKDPQFKDHMIDLLRKHSVDFWIPILDEEIIEAAHISLSNHKLSTVVHTQNIEASGLCFDKLKMASWLEQNGFATPLTLPILNAKWQSAGWFVKPRFGRGSHGTGILNNKKDFEAAKKASPESLVQEIARLPELTVDVYVPVTGSGVRAMCRERIEVKSGVCTKARVHYDAGLEKTAHRLAEGLKLAGGFCFQVLSSKSGQWVITDINPGRAQARPCRPPSDLMLARH